MERVSGVSRGSRERRPMAQRGGSAMRCKANWELCSATVTNIFEVAAKWAVEILA